MMLLLKNLDAQIESLLAQNRASVADTYPFWELFLCDETRVGQKYSGNNP